MFATSRATLGPADRGGYRIIKETLMPDICMCRGGECPLKATCHRHTAKRNKLRQTMFADPPYNPVTRLCTYYWPVAAKDTKPQRKGDRL